MARISSGKTCTHVRQEFSHCAHGRINLVQGGLNVFFLLSRDPVGHDLRPLGPQEQALYQRFCSPLRGVDSGGKDG